MATPIEDVKDELRKAKGIVSVAAKNLGITRNALDRRIQRNKTLQKIKRDARETIIDLAEAKLYKAINNEDFRAIKYTLSTLGKERGYVERVEQEQVGEAKKQIFKFGDIAIEF